MKIVKVFNKLVRDKFPEIIKMSGSTCEIKIFEGKEKQEFLEKKLMEEVNEYLKIKT